MHYVVSILVLDAKERSGYVALFVLLVSHDCCLALPQDATDLSAVCDCGIFCSYSLTILGTQMMFCQ